MKKYTRLLVLGGLVLGLLAACAPPTPPPGPEIVEVTRVVTEKEAVVLQSMLKFYDRFAQQNRGNVNLQEETARAYRRVGDIQQRLGNFEEAEKAYRQGLATYGRLIERAKGILMKNYNISEEKAFKTIQQQSRRARKNMREIAESIILLEDLEGTKLKSKRKKR